MDIYLPLCSSILNIKYIQLFCSSHTSIKCFLRTMYEIIYIYIFLIFLTVRISESKFSYIMSKKQEPTNKTKHHRLFCYITQRSCFTKL